MTCGGKIESRLLFLTRSASERTPWKSLAYASGCESSGSAAEPSNARGNGASEAIGFRAPSLRHRDDRWAMKMLVPLGGLHAANGDGFVDIFGGSYTQLSGRSLTCRQRI